MKYVSNAVLTKARALSGLFLKEENYEELIHKQSLKQVTQYLKTIPSYEKILRHTSDDIHRGELEKYLHQNAYIHLGRLLRYSDRKTLEFYRLQVIPFEITFLLKKLSDINYEVDVPDYLKKYGHISFTEFSKVTCREEINQLLKKTIYKEICDKENLSEIQYILKRIYYDTYFDTVRRLFRRKTRELLETVMLTRIELDNVIMIYRLKHYFECDSETILKQLDCVHTRIPEKKWKQWCELPTGEEVLEALRHSPYHYFTGEKDYIYIEYYSQRIIYNLAKRHLRYSTDPSIVYMTYSILLNIEIDNIIHIIEGIRYHEEPDKIQEMLIY